jgi:hypothetical protein
MKCDERAWNFEVGRPTNSTFKKLTCQYEMPGDRLLLMSKTARPNFQQKGVNVPTGNCTNSFQHRSESVAPPSPNSTQDRAESVVPARSGDQGSVLYNDRCLPPHPTDVVESHVSLHTWWTYVRAWFAGAEVPVTPENVTEMTILAEKLGAEMFSLGVWMFKRICPVHG